MTLTVLINKDARGDRKMSGSDRESYRGVYEEVERSFSTPEGRDERKGRVKSAREDVVHKAALPRAVRDTSQIYDSSMVRPTITHPKPGVNTVHVVLVDNSGSNRAIAQHLRNSSGYLVAGLSSMDPTSQTAFIYFSDHCDGGLIMQEVDFFSPDAEGDRVLASTTHRVRDASGGDEPEAIECALKRVCEIDFGSATKKHLYLVSDVVGHGMGMEGDDGCPNQQNWKRSVELVGRNFTSFEVIGCGDSPQIVELQKQFLAPDRVALDLIDLSSIRETRHRQAITGNALLFLIARHLGRQTIQMFLSVLYEKWLSDPIFHGETDRRAKQMIQRFLKYIDLPDDVVDKMRADILVE